MVPRQMVGIAGCLLIFACSDDNGTPPDSKPWSDLQQSDQSMDGPSDDGPLDLAVEGVSDQAAMEATPLDGGSDADLAPTDISPPDGPLADAGPVAISGTISRSVSPVLDAKGNIYIGLFILPPPAPFQFGGTVVKGAHLISTTTKVSYALPAAPGNYWLYAFLDDNSNAVAFPMAMPDAVDIGMAQAVQVKVVAGQQQTIDIDLSKIGGYAGGADGGLGTFGALKGTVKATASPSQDGKGTLWFSLHTQPPPMGVVGQPIAQNAADLSSPFAQEVYYLGNLKPGKYYMRVFLDDNGNAPFLSPNPDPGDLIHTNPIQVHVVAGTVTNHNVVLDKVQ